MTAPERSGGFAGFWLTAHPWLWNVVDDFGQCVPVNPFVFAAWVDSGK